MPLTGKGYEAKEFAAMPLTSKGRKILQQMQKQYGPEKGKQVFYAARNKGRITDVDRPSRPAQMKRRTFREPR